jgi:hypothetical protein
MIKKHAKKGKRIAIEAAKTIIKPVGEELVEIPKQTVKEVVGREDTGASPFVEAMQQKTEEKELKITQDGNVPKKKLDYLEKELDELKGRREHEKQKEKLALKKEMLEKDEKHKPPLEPSTKKKRGLHIFGKKKTKGTGEIIKGKK